MEGNTRLALSTLPKNIPCPSCPRRFASRKALENHSKALHMSLSPSQTEAIAASVSQARGSKVHNASRRPAPPTGHLNEQPQYTPLARQSLPPNSNPKEQPTDSPPAKSPSPPPSRSPSLSIGTQNHSAHQDDADALTFQLLGLSLYPAEPKIYPPPTEAEFLRQESQQGHGYLILRDEPDELNAHNEYVKVPPPSHVHY